MKNYYVYMFKANDIPFYVGSARRRDEYTNPYRREYEHLWESGKPTSQQTNIHKCSYLNRPHVFEVIIDNLSLVEAREKELELILEYKRIRDGGTLTNIVISLELMAHNTRRVPVFQFTTNGGLINKYTSILQASQQTGILSSGIVSCCKGVNATSGGFVWGYTEAFPGYTKPPEVWNKRAIDQYTLDGIFVSSYASTMEAEKQTGIARGPINACVRGETATSGGFVWVETGKPFVSPPPRRSGKPKKQVEQIDMNTNKVIKTYESVSLAMAETGYTGISRCALGYSKSSGGYYWRTVE